ncbi:hypothetical protein HJG60_009174 [Phyllostomus discolor]|uniref:Uncharacterized protein n=1 Tax=Phyllostomus discolor TaxID=89673 RepID=A0A833YMF6_9CHIR|nr:hypothetical protein HJG60_009174 [Phyllostomus discolor]
MSGPVPFSKRQVSASLCSPADKGHLHCPWFGAVVNKAAINMLILYGNTVFIPEGIHPGAGRLGPQAPCVLSGAPFREGCPACLRLPWGNTWERDVRSKVSDVFRVPFASSEPSRLSSKVISPPVSCFHPH